MKILKWTGIAVTTLFVLMNIGTVPDREFEAWVRVLAAALAVAGIAAVVGFTLDKSWGRSAAIGVGLANALCGAIAIVVDIQGGVVGLVVGLIGAGLSFLAKPSAAGEPVTA